MICYCCCYDYDEYMIAGVSVLNGCANVKVVNAGMGCKLVKRICLMYGECLLWKILNSILVCICCVWKGQGEVSDSLNFS